MVNVEIQYDPQTGNLGIRSGGANHVLILGILEFAKFTLMQQSAKEPARIVPAGALPGLTAQ